MTTTKFGRSAKIQKNCQLADIGLSKTDTVKQALEHAFWRLSETLPLRERLKPLQDRVLARPSTNQDADKAFYAELSGEPG